MHASLEDDLAVFVLRPLLTVAVAKAGNERPQCRGLDKGVTGADLMIRSGQPVFRECSVFNEGRVWIDRFTLSFLMRCENLGKGRGRRNDSRRRSFVEAPGNGVGVGDEQECESHERNNARCPYYMHEDTYIQQVDTVNLFGEGRGIPLAGLADRRPTSEMDDAGHEGRR